MKKLSITRISDMPNMVFFSSPIGLGHATRDIAISQHFENVSKLFVTGNAAHKLVIEYGFAAEDLYRPPSFRIKNGRLQDPMRWLFNYYSYYKECKAICSQILEKCSSLIISDEDF